MTRLETAMPQDRTLHKIPLSVIAAIFSIGLLLAGCSQEKYGTGIDPAAPTIKARDIFLQPQLIGKKVTLEGTVHTQCASNGCWFVLQDDTARIYIDLATNNFQLPPMQGRTVRATGTVTSHQNNLLLVAEGVEAR